MKTTSATPSEIIQSRSLSKTTLPIPTLCENHIIKASLKTGKMVNEAEIYRVSKLDFSYVNTFETLHRKRKAF